MGKKKIKPTKNKLTRYQFQLLRPGYALGKFPSTDGSGKQMCYAISTAGISYVGKNWFVVNKQIEADYNAAVAQLAVKEEEVTSS